MSDEKLTPSQAEIIRAIPERFPVEQIDTVWIFPPRFAPERELGLFVLALEPTAQSASEQRILVTLRYETQRTGRREKREEWVTEEGRAPSEHIERVIAGVLSRMRVEEGDPIPELVGCDADRWASLIGRLCPAP